MNQKENQAIDLMLEDLHTNHYEIRVTAKRLECEDELDRIKNTLINYLKDLK
jgi:hypothetical protein